MGAGRPPALLRCLRVALAGDAAPAHGAHVLVGVSGGPDSVALAAGLAELSGEAAMRLTLGQVRHGLRDASDEDADEAVVHALAARLGVAHRVRRLDVRPGPGEEARARRARHAALLEMADAAGARFVALAHTRDDQAETVLLRLLRGAGRGGLGGMAPRRGRVLRPLLAASRADVRRYLAERELAFSIDRSNADIRFTRNRLRRMVLPLLEAEFNPRLREQLAVLAERLRDEDRFLEDAADEAAAALVRGEALDRRVAALPPALGRRVVRRWLAEPGVAAVAAVHVERVLRLAGGRAGGAIAIPGGRRIVREAGKLVRRQGGPVAWTAFRLAVRPGETVHGPSWTLQVSTPRAWGAHESPRCGPTDALLDADALAGELCVRSVRRGDRIHLPGVGTRRVSEVLIDRKVPRERRGAVPLLASGDEPLWIPGLVRGSQARVGAETRRVLAVRFASEDKLALPLRNSCGSVEARRSGA